MKETLDVLLEGVSKTANKLNADKKSLEIAVSLNQINARLSSFEEEFKSRTEILNKAFDANANLSRREDKMPGVFPHYFKQLTRLQVEQLEEIRKHTKLFEKIAGSYKTVEPREVGAKKEKNLVSVTDAKENPTPAISSEATESTDGKKSLLEKVTTVQQVSIEQFEEPALNGLGETLQEVLPKAIKEGLSDVVKAIEGIKNGPGTRPEGGGGGGGLISSVLSGLGIASLLKGGGGRGLGKAVSKRGFLSRIFGKAALPAAAAGGAAAVATTAADDAAPKPVTDAAKVADDAAPKPAGVPGVAKGTGILSKTTSYATKALKSAKSGLKTFVGSGLTAGLGGEAVGELAESGIKKLLGFRDDYQRMGSKNLKYQTEQAKEAGRTEDVQTAGKIAGLEKEHAGQEMLAKGGGLTAKVLGTVGIQKMVDFVKPKIATAVKPAMETAKGLVKPAMETAKGLVTKGFNAGARAVTEAASVASKRADKIFSLLKATPRSKIIWKLFLRWMKRKNLALATRIATKLATAAGMALVPGPGWVGMLITAGFALYDAYEIYQLWQEFCALSEIETDALAQEEKLENGELKLSDENAPKVPEDQNTPSAASPKNEAVSLKDIKKAPEVKPVDTKAPEVKPADTKAPEVKPINIEKNLPAVNSETPANKIIKKILESKPTATELKKIRDEYEKKAKEAKNEANGDLYTDVHIKLIELAEDRAYEERTKGLSESIDKKLKSSADSIKNFGDGGIVTKPTIARVAERGEPEGIFPLSKLADFKDIIGSSLGNNDSKQIVKNTEKTNSSISELAANFALLANALKSLGVSIAERPPTVVNNITKGGESKQQKMSASQMASKGNSEISAFRNAVERARFIPA